MAGGGVRKGGGGKGAGAPDRRRETRGLDDGEDEVGVKGMRWSAASREKNSRMNARRP